SVVGVSSAEIGFVAAGGVSAPYASWSRDAWRDRDLRLLDDASPNPSPYRDAGSVDNMSRYDVQGAFRGRETDGVATCSPGAYETIQAGLFWVGEPFPQEMVDAAPQNVRIANYRQTTGSDVYFEADMTWEIPDGAVYSKIVAQYKSPSSGDFVAAGTLSGDATGRKSTQMREGSRYIVRVRGVFKNGDYTAWAYIDFVARAALDDADGGGQTSGIMLPSPLSVVNPSFLKPDGWATSRFATASSDAAPQIGQTVFVDGNVRFVDVLSTTSAQTFGLTVGGGAVVAVDAASRVYFDKLQIALGASFTSTATAQARMSTRCGAWSRINSQFDAATPCDFDAKSYLAYAVFYTAYIPNAATYGALKVATASNDMIRLSGEYVCDVFSTAQNGTATDQTIRVGDGSATIRARQFRFGGDGASNYVESFFDRPVTLKLQGAASVSLPSARRESWADDFLIDVTESTSATLSLCGQTVYGDAPTAAIELSGSAKIDERGLDVASLTLAAGATLSVDGGKVCVAELNVADGATVAFSPVATDGTYATYVDAVLSATTAATVGAATFTGVGYFATPTETDLTSATFAEDVRVCDCGASLTSFLAAPGVSGVALAWTVANADASVLLERQNANGWAVVETRAVGGSARVDGLAPGTTLFRAFDGAQFLTAQTLVQASHIRLDYDDSSVVALAPVYEVVLEIVLMSDYRNRGESPLLLARVADSATGDFIPKDAVASIVYSARRVETLYGSKRYVDVEGHVDREIPLDAYFDLPVADDPRWLASY
ncbi:MAG: hypothetical protein IKK39_11835, partial [Thermoguttaceae bacterium]|nr:hypothetical protein [Thermoguttaceae bacterium]